MKKPGKITAIILLSASLGSWFFINKNISYDRPTSDKISFIDRSTITSSPTSSIPLKATLDKEKGHLNWSNQQIIERLNHQDSLILLKTLSHILIYQDRYHKHYVIMDRIRQLGNQNKDPRISGLAALIQGKQISSTRLKQNLPVLERVDSDSSPLERDDDQFELDDEKQDTYAFNTDNSDSTDSEKRIYYIDELVSRPDDSNIDELAALVLDPDGEVSVAAIDALILSLTQGMGNPDEIKVFLEENITLLDELQIQTLDNIPENSIVAEEL